MKKINKVERGLASPSNRAFIELSLRELNIKLEVITRDHTTAVATYKSKCALLEEMIHSMKIQLENDDVKTREANLDPTSDTVDNESISAARHSRVQEIDKQRAAKSHQLAEEHYPMYAGDKYIPRIKDPTL